MTTNAFTASTKEVMERLGLGNNKTLFRRRTDFQEKEQKVALKFLEPGIHFRRMSPGSTRLVWDLDRTVKAWEAALKLQATGAAQ